MTKYQLSKFRKEIKSLQTTQARLRELAALHPMLTYAVAQFGAADAALLWELAQSDDHILRATLALNPHAPTEFLIQLCHDPHELPRLEAIRVMYRADLTRAQAEGLAQNTNPYVAKSAQFELEHWHERNPTILSVAQPV